MHFSHETSSWQCPFHCGAQETSLHFCTCPSSLATSIRTTHMCTLSDTLSTINTCPSLRCALIEAISIHCGETVTESFCPSIHSSRACRIVNAVQSQINLGMSNLLKGRFTHDVLNLQLEYLTTTYTPGPVISPDIRWWGWKIKFIQAFFTFTLCIWNDRNQVLHGNSLNHSRIPIAEYVHRYVRTEYKTFSNEVDQFLTPHLANPLQERLTQPLKALCGWLKRVEESRSRQALLQKVTTKITVLRSEGHFVDAIRVLRLSNRFLKRWITSKLQPVTTAQTHLERFFA